MNQEIVITRDRLVCLRNVTHELLETISFHEFKITITDKTITITPHVTPTEITL